MNDKKYKAIWVSPETHRKFKVVASALNLTHADLIEKFLKSKVADVKDVLN